MKTQSKTYSEVQVLSEPTIRTGNETLDEFISFDGGFVVGSLIFLTGTSGAGKTTFAIILQKAFEQYKSSLYSREMSAVSVKHQMKHYAIEHQNAFIADKGMCPNIDAYLKELEIIKPALIIVDSLQVIAKEDFPEISEAAAALDIIEKFRVFAEANRSVVIIIGHVNKDEKFEGKNTIEHMFDAHLEMIFDKKKNTRTLSWTKNRKGMVGKSLFYQFGEKSLEFFTPEQWEFNKEHVTLPQAVGKIMNEYMNNVKIANKGNDKFKSFMVDYKNWINGLNKLEPIKDALGISTLFMKFNELLEKHDLG